MRVAFFSDTFDQYAPVEEKYSKLGRNTGNILFMTAIKSIIDCEILSNQRLEDMDGYDAFITTSLVWIRENTDPSPRLLKQVEMAKGRPVIPISVGLQSASYRGDFKFSDRMITLLRELDGHCTLGVRGEFTADVLQRNGVKNISVIGCPSVYQIPMFHDDLGFLFRKNELVNSVANYASFATKLSEVDCAILKFIMSNCGGFVEQTFSLSERTMPDADMRDWFLRNSNLFFDLDSWIRHNRRYEFSFGLRFHGNVAAILGGIRALFVISDSRTQEMTELFKLPSVSKSRFDTRLSLSEHFQSTDFAEFAKGYQTNLNRFQRFLQDNSLTLSPHFAQRLSRFSCS